MQIVYVKVPHWHLFSLFFSKFPLSIFGLKAFVGRISQLLSALFRRARGFWVGGEMAINQVKGKEEEIPGLSHVLTHKWVPSALSAHSLASIRNSRHYPTQWFPRGNSFFVSLTQENQCRQTDRAGTHSSSLHAHSDGLCLEIPSLQFIPQGCLAEVFWRLWHFPATSDIITRAHNHVAQLSPHCTSSTFAPQSTSTASHLNIKPLTNSLLLFSSLSHFPLLCSHWMP